MLSKILTSAIIFLAFNFSTFAQADTTVTAASEAPASSLPVISGSLDLYYRYNFDNIPSFAHSNNFTSFTNTQNSFELGMASLRLDHTIGKVSATLDLGFGKRAEEFSYADSDNSTLFAIKQGYLSYAFSDKFKMTMGKWATHIGYELVDAYLNRNYSMSYMFSYGPFSHTGLKADISLGGKSALMVGVANTTDYVTTSASPKFILGQFSTASSDSKFKAYLNFQGGSSGTGYKLAQGDVVFTYALSDQFSLGYNGTVQSRNYKDSVGRYQDANSWWGSALYVNLDPTSTFGVTLRAEYLSDKKNILGFNTSIFDVTLSPNIKVGNLTIIPELRLDAGRDPLFSKAKERTSKSTVSAILGAAYHF